MNKLKLYANENLRRQLVNELRKLGYDVLTSKDAGQDHQSIPDDEVLRFAHAQSRAVINNRKDFRKLHRHGNPHSGLILCQESRDDFDYAQLIDNQLMGVDNISNQLIEIKP